MRRMLAHCCAFCICIHALVHTCMCSVRGNRGQRTEAPPTAPTRQPRSKQMQKLTTTVPQDAHHSCAVPRPLRRHDTMAGQLGPCLSSNAMQRGARAKWWAVPRPAVGKGVLPVCVVTLRPHVRTAGHHTRHVNTRQFHAAVRMSRCQGDGTAASRS